MIMLKGRSLALTYPLIQRKQAISVILKNSLTSIQILYFYY